MRFNTRYNTAMTDDQIRAVAPSVFAAQPHESRSERYAFVPTIDVLNGLRREGFQVFEAKQSRTRQVDRRGFATHILRLRHPDMRQLDRVGDEQVEIVLRNSHDGAGPFELMQGVYRLVCSNGMVVGSTHASFKVPHRGNIIDDVIEGSYRIVEDTALLGSVIDEWKGIQLDGPEQMALAHAAAKLRFPDADADKVAVVTQLNTPRRADDVGRDLWTTFNRVQEGIIRGGVQLGRSEKGRRRTARGITGVEQDLALNKALWTLADHLAKFKQAA